MERTDLQVAGFPVRIEGELPPDAFILLSTDRHGIPKAAVGMVNGRVVGPVYPEEIHGSKEERDARR